MKNMAKHRILEVGVITVDMLLFHLNAMKILYRYTLEKKKGQIVVLNSKLLNQLLTLKGQFVDDIHGSLQKIRQFELVEDKGSWPEITIAEHC